MDGELAELHRKLDRLLEQAAAISVTLSWTDGAIEGVRHYSVIEEHAHQLGRRLSRLVQAEQTKQVVTSQPRQHRCPHCGSSCDLEIGDRTMISIDGKVKIPDPVGHCRKCRRDFFQRHDTRLKEPTVLVGSATVAQPSRWQTIAVS